MIGPTTYRLAWKRQMVKRYRALAVLTVLVFGGVFVVPAGLSADPTAIVTGHSVFYNGDGFDPCLASIVGIMRMRVMWFNDHVLVERYNGDGAYIYVNQDNEPDPRNKNLLHSGVFYDFVDPNGVEWHVDEAYWITNVKTETPDPEIESLEPGEVGVDPGGGGVQYVRHYTWIVAVGKPQRDAWRGSDNHDFYNFVTIVNTCKFIGGNQTSAFLGLRHDYNPTPHNGHEADDPAHTHETYGVNLWVGTAPKILPVGAETPNWVGAQAGSAQGQAYTTPTPGTP